ncbi:transposase [Palleronia abyssalis]|uniref:transposase n=1 Tax=Palleronia abyssalis TaxID=1501240 RepID=UPI003F9936AD
MNTKLHAICDSQGRPLDLFVTAGQVSDYIGARALFSSLPNAEWLLGDRGYDADWFREALQNKRDTCLHPRPKAAQENRQIRQASIQTPKPDRDHVRQAEGLAARGNPLRPLPKGVSLFHRTGRARHLLVINPDPNPSAFCERFLPGPFSKFFERIKCAEWLGLMRTSVD